MPLQPPPAGSLRARILAGETLYGTFVSSGAPIMAELCARADFDWLIVDLEHGAATESELMGQLHAIGDRTTALVRPQSTERLRIGGRNSDPNRRNIGPGAESFTSDRRDDQRRLYCE